MKVGNHVYYQQSEGQKDNTVPAIVLKIGKKRIKIHGNFLDGDKNVWVSKEKLFEQTAI